MTEVVIDVVNEYALLQWSKDALSEQLIRVLQDEKGREAVALRALEYIRKNHD